MVEHAVSITFPNLPEYLRLARLASSDVGTRAGFDFEEIDDLKIAVSELCGLLMTGDHAPLTLELVFDASGLVVTGRSPTVGSTPSQLSEAIVAALVDEHETDVGPAGSSFRIRKQSRGSPQPA